MPAAEETAEEIVLILVEMVGGEELREDIVSLREVKVTKGGRFRPIEAVGIIDLSLFGVREVLIGLCDFSKLLNSLVTVVWVLVRVPLDGELLVGLLDVRLRGTFAQA
jgi:hypothetical protein